MDEHGISYLAHTGRPAPNYVVGPVIAKARSVQIKFLDQAVYSHLDDRAATHARPGHTLLRGDTVVSSHAEKPRSA